MVALSTRLATPKLNSESSHNPDKKKNYLQLANWASGASAPYVRFSKTVTTTWLTNLFTEVARTAGHRLDRGDLFHCHLVFDVGDLLMVFHAKEYPSDIEPFKYGQAVGLDRSVADFETKDSVFKKRDVIYSVAHNRIYVPNFTNNGNPFRSLLYEPNLTVRGNPLLLDATMFGDCIADISTFPRENVKPFAKIWSLKAAQPVCDLCAHKHTEGSSTSIGRWHYCAACTCFYCNTCGKWKLKRNSNFSRTRACKKCKAETTLVD